MILAHVNYLNYIFLLKRTIRRLDAAGKRYNVDQPLANHLIRSIATDDRPQAQGIEIIQSHFVSIVQPTTAVQSNDHAARTTDHRHELHFNDFIARRQQIDRGHLR